MRQDLALLKTTAPAVLCDGICKSYKLQLDRERAENERLLFDNDRFKRELHLTDVIFYKGGLTPTETMILHGLLNRKMISKEFYLNVIGDESDDLLEPIKILDVFMCKLRKKLKDYKPIIETAWGVGWFIQPLEQKRLKALLIEGAVS
jgi:DNA-binding response OmpR family regulator